MSQKKVTAKITLLNVLHEPFDKRMYYKLAQSFINNGYDVYSICPWKEDTAPTSNIGVHFIIYPYKKGWLSRIKSIYTLFKLGKQVSSDIYIAPEPESWVSALLIKLRKGGKVIFDMHEHNPNKMAQFFPRFLQPIIEYLTLKVMRIFARFTDMIILTRESFEPMWSGVSTPRITIINTNHLQDVCSNIPQELIDKYAHVPTIIHQGVFGTIRGSYQLLDAMEIAVKEIPDLCCIVLGEYVYGSEEEYKQAILDKKLADHIHMLGVVPFEKVPEYIRVSKIGLILFQPGFLNHTLAMPHKLFDYMREEIPVIVPDFAIEVSKIVKESECGLCVDVTNPKAIADAIIYLIKHPEEAQRLGRNGRKAIEMRYNWQKEEKILIESIDKLVAGKHSEFL